MIGHSWGTATAFCGRCGIARLQWVEAGVGCIQAENVVALKPWQARRSIQWLVDGLDELLAMNQDNWPTDEDPQAA